MSKPPEETISAAAAVNDGVPSGAAGRQRRGGGTSVAAEAARRPGSDRAAASGEHELRVAADGADRHGLRGNAARGHDEAAAAYYRRADVGAVGFDGLVGAAAD